MILGALAAAALTLWVLWPVVWPAAAAGLGIVCRNCGARPETDAKFCSSCGARLGG